jgi:hypothetical protein
MLQKVKKISFHLLLTVYWTLWATVGFAYYFANTATEYPISSFGSLLYAVLLSAFSLFVLLIGVAILALSKNSRKRGFLRFVLFITVPVIFAVLLKFSVDFRDNELVGTEQNIELNYISWGCDCANWAETKVVNEKWNDYDRLNSTCYFIEPATDSLTLPDSFHVSNNRIIFTGRFYKYPKFPKGYYSQEHPDPALVFRYTKYELKSPFNVWSEARENESTEWKRIK